MLGWLRAVRGDVSVSRFQTQKTGLLLAYLALYLERSHTRETLIEALWPEVDPAAGRNRLKQALASLRRQLEPPGPLAGNVLLADRFSLRLNPAAASDVAAFETLLRDASEEQDPAGKT